MFFQEPPRLGNQYDDDPLFQEALTRMLPEPVLAQIVPELRHLGELAAGELYELQLADRCREPELISWDAWGQRVDRVELTQLWRRAAVLAAEHGLVAVAYERPHGELSRIHQMAMAYLLDASLDVYTCPLAMTDGAARTLLDSGNHALVERALPRLISRNPARAWTSGQWMTEKTGGSDVGSSEAIARASSDGQYKLYGTKWFTSAISSDVALTLARPEGNPPGGRGLAVFYLELRLADGRLNGILVHRLKDKLGTRKVPTAELTLDGTVAVPVRGLSEGVRGIAPMLNVTRTWNAVAAIAGMRRAVALARDYARRRSAFGAVLSEQPLHVDTIAAMQAELEAAVLLVMRGVELLGRCDAGVATDAEHTLQRAITPIAKLVTAKQAVAVVSEALECFGGAGYVEDTGLPRLLRDAQVLPIWEGTTNVLSLDLLRALKTEGSFGALTHEVGDNLRRVRDPELRSCVETAQSALEHTAAFAERVRTDRRATEASARRFAMTVGRTLELALLASHAQWCVDRGRSRRSVVAARRFALSGVDLLVDVPLADSDLLGS